MATPLTDSQFRLENAPFFISEISYGDIVSAAPSKVSEQFDFTKLVAASEFTSISIILLSREMDVFLMDLFRGHNCVIEFGEFGNLRMLSVAVPLAEDYSRLRDQLQLLEEREKLSFAELALAGERDLAPRSN